MEPRPACVVQQYGAPGALRMATVSFLAPRDEMWLSTLDAMDTELVSEGLVYRYDSSASPTTAGVGGDLFRTRPRATDADVAEPRWKAAHPARVTGILATHGSHAAAQRCRS